MPTFEFTLVVTLPPGAPEPKTYTDALFAVGVDYTAFGDVVLRQIALNFSRHAGTEYGAIEIAVREFLNAVTKVRRGAGSVDEIYQIEVQVEGKRIGEAGVHFKQNGLG